MLQKPFPILQLDSLHPITAQSCLILGPFVDIVSCVSGVYRVVNQNDPIIIRLILVSKNGNCYYGLHVLEIVITIILILTVKGVLCRLTMIEDRFIE